MKPGNLIFLNGNSSSGKSTIAKLMQAELTESFLHTGIDHFLVGVPNG
jgi:chloramphenicol 3-O phosphotransferase